MYTWRIFGHMVVSVIRERREKWLCTFILVCLSWYIFRRSRAMRRLTIGPRSARPRNKSPLWESMESNMGTGLVLSMFGTVTDEDLKDHQSSSKGNLAKSQRFEEEESELFVQYFHLIRRALFPMQNKMQRKFPNSRWSWNLPLAKVGRQKWKQRGRELFV